MRGAVVVVTGASSGIGRATALACAGRGARVVLAARSGAVLDEVAGECRRRGGEGFAVPTDVADERAVRELADRSVARFGRVDVWVNAAGVGILGRFDQVPSAELRRLLGVNVLGAVHGARAVLPVMRRQGGGVVIDVASLLGGVVVAPYLGGYAMSKAALVVFDDVLRQELALAGERHIEICTLLPAAVDTPFFRRAGNRSGRAVGSLPPVATPERVARAVVRTAVRPRPRVLVGPYARLLVAAHALARRPVDRVAARRTDRTYLGPVTDVPPTGGILYEASGAGAAVHGGRHGGPRTAARRTAAAGLVLGAVLAASRRRARPSEPRNPG
ncbi:SDR family NAD(P)-dependent oxidoreductase [Streptomyces griseus]|uniref:SDR family NAD(P)-dependent oxidoreductase n=1 Tax=Streptomyces griseus TaxID=1911 RepID=UPI001F400931|nr:SDR family NAD(P)-dependent oxidoreductase [Streptomyces griseus]